MGRISRILAATAAAVTLAAATGFAQGRAPRTARPRMQRFMAGLNLTDAQRDQIHLLRDQHRVAIRDQVQQVREARRALRQETFADAPDQSKIDSIQQQVAALSQQIEASRLDLQERIAQVLTPEQRQYMRDRQRQIRSSRGRRGR